MSVLQEQHRAVWARLGRRRAFIAMGIAAVGAGLALNWHWLTAIGVAPVLIAFAPCAAMCVLGLCMNRMSGRSCSTSPGAGTARGQIASPRSEPSSAEQSTERNCT
ncbi:MAG: hypothetical protein KGJ66_15600 [Alphaproteobacteria bacterium]|nr:hypothetical protein [Alphaproteobacteria bacterium]